MSYRRYKSVVFYILYIGVLTLFSSLPATADLAVIDGISWTYKVQNRCAVIGNGTDPAIPPETSGAIFIPSYLGGYPVVSINKKAFYYCDKLELAFISGGVTNIGDSAFCSSSKLSFVSFPDQLKVIDDFAFFLCKNLSSVYFPSTLERIGAFVFGNCSKLSTIHLPAKLSKFGFGAFSRCSAVETVTVESENPSYQVIDNVLYTKDGEKLVFYPPAKKGDFRIPDHVLEVIEGVFHGCHSISAIEFPPNVKEIKYFAFEDCPSLKTMTFEGKIPRLWDNWISGISATIRALVVDREDWLAECEKQQLGLEVYSEDGLFYDHVDGIWWGYEIADGEACIRNGNESAIPKDTAGTVIIPETLGGVPVTGIGKWAFADCQSITSVSIPAKVRHIGERAFSDCGNLKEIVADPGNSSYQIIERCLYAKDGKVLLCCPGGARGRVNVPNGTCGIADHAFQGCHLLVDIILPESVTTIGAWAFAGCRSLISFSIPSGVRSIKNGTFFKCESLLSIALPDHLLIIGDGAFNRCRSLDSILFPGQLRKIGDSAFEHCSALSSVEIPASLVFIGERALCDCKTITFRSTIKPDLRNEWAGSYGKDPQTLVKVPLNYDPAWDECGWDASFTISTYELR